MFKLKEILFILILLSVNFVNAKVLEIGDEESNLEIMMDVACANTTANTNTISETQEEMKAPRTQMVETVNYTLHDFTGVSSFPVTIRSNKRKGE